MLRGTLEEERLIEAIPDDIKETLRDNLHEELQAELYDEITQPMETEMEQLADELQTVKEKLEELEMEIKVEIKNNYGVDTVYPVCDKAKLFARIARTKTLTLDTLKLVEALGYEIIFLPTSSTIPFNFKKR